MAKAGRGGNLLKSVKKPLMESMVNDPTQVTRINVVPKNILFRILFSHFVFFNTILKPVKIITKHNSVSKGHKKPGVEKLFFIVECFIVYDLITQRNCTK